MAYRAGKGQVTNRTIQGIPVHYRHTERQVNTLTESVKNSQVVTFVGESRRERVIFDGLRDDAVTFLVQHFPRLHVEPGSPDAPMPDAILQDENGARTFYDGRDWAEYRPVESSSSRTPQPDDRDEEIARLRERVAQLSAGEPAQEPAPDAEPVL